MRSFVVTASVRSFVVTASVLAEGSSCCCSGGDWMAVLAAESSCCCSGGDWMAAVATWVAAESRVESSSGERTQCGRR